MPRGAAPRALLSAIVVIVAVALAVAPTVDAGPRDKDRGKRDNVAAEARPGDTTNQANPPAETAPPQNVATDDASGSDGRPPADQSLAANVGGAAGNDRTLLALDADGDYLPDALDNCPAIQNPDQSDADGDGIGDACPVYQDTDGDGAPDKDDNCPGVATSDFADRDGDGLGDPCDKSPDGIEPEPEPVPELDGRGGQGEEEPPAAENGENQDGRAIERGGRERSRQRERTDRERPTITTGEDADAGETTEGGAQEEPAAAEPVVDDPFINEELIAEAAASGELNAPPEPPPVPQRAWDEDDAAAGTWEPVIRIDAGATADAVAPNGADEEPSDQGDTNGNRERRNRSEEAAGDSEFARGWMRARLILQDEAQEPAQDEVQEPAPEDEGDDAGHSGQGVAPVPVENGLVITSPGGTNADPEPRDEESADDGGGEPGEADPGDDAADPEPRDEVQQPDSREERRAERRNQQERSGRNDGGRRDGSSRAAAAAPDQRQAAAANRDEERQDAGRNRRRDRDRGAPQGWSDDRYFDGGAALNWSGDVAVAGTDDDELYLTQRSGFGPGRRRGFEYAIPVEGNGVFLVRLYFAEPYWGSPGGPGGEDGRRVFSVVAEGERVIDGLDVFAEAGSLTALVKQVEVEVVDGELNLRFTAQEGEPIVAAIEVLQPAP